MNRKKRLAELLAAGGVKVDAHTKVHAMLQVDIECLEEKQKILIETLSKTLTALASSTAMDFDVPSLFDRMEALK